MGVLFLVAVWFWGPLVWGWVAPEKKAKAAAPAPTQGPGGLPAASPTGSNNQKSETPEPSWEQVVQWMEQDFRTTPHVQVPGRADPFHPAKHQGAPGSPGGDNEEGGEVQVAGPPPDPENLGASVTSTVVGPVRRVALVNGQTYELGEDVTFSLGDQTVTFRLVGIERDGIVLEREGKRFDLKVPRPQPSGRIDIQKGI